MAKVAILETQPKTASAETTASGKRRLSDKVADAFAQAVKQGRKEIADRLRLVHQSIVDEETVFQPTRRIVEGSDW